MAIRVALNHKTSYDYDREVTLSPQVVRLRPAPHSRTPIAAYALKIEPEGFFLNWQQDPHGNYLARIVFPKPVMRFSIEVDVIAEMTVINPFDFFLEPDSEEFPVVYDPTLAEEIAPFRRLGTVGPKLQTYIDKIDRTPRRTVDFLVEVNHKLSQEIKYTIRLEPGVQTPEETLTLGSGSCRDTAWLLVHILRNLGFAARFVSGYLIQLVADVKSLDGPSGPPADFTDLHAWTEVYLPGAGWVGLDPTSGLFAGEGHIPLACTPDVASAAPVSGMRTAGEAEFGFAMTVERVHEDPRVTKPYTEDQWEAIQELGYEIDADLREHDVRLTMGGEPTFVSIDDMDGAEWNTAAVGPNKRRLAGDLILRLRDRFAQGGLLHYGQGKWYPGESLPRWALTCYWRKDGTPIWRNPDHFASEKMNYGHRAVDAHRFTSALARRLAIDPKFSIAGYEDVWYYMWKERKLPVNVDPLASKLDNEEDRRRLAKVFEQGLGSVVGYTLPIRRGKASQGEDPNSWVSGHWFLRQEHMYLLPGDSPMGFRLPLDSIPWAAKVDKDELIEVDPFAPRGELADYQAREQLGRTKPRQPIFPELGRDPGSVPHQPAYAEALALQSGQLGPTGANLGPAGWWADQAALSGSPGAGTNGVGANGAGANGSGVYGTHGPGANGVGDQGGSGPGPYSTTRPGMHQSASWITRTAMCIEPREGRLHVFMPPVEAIEDYLDLISAVEATAEETGLPVVIEGYPPPYDYRLQHVKVTPDPGVIEVNVHPAHDWNELLDITTGVYEDARVSRLCAEKFMLDGRHTGTGGGNHVVMGGPTPADSPFLRRPDLLRSLLSYWHNHPSLSYIFSGQFLGPTSQAPRVDEARNDALYELEIAHKAIPDDGGAAPWLVDRIYRHLLVDVTGNTHRAEFCIDKLFSPDSATGRLGLVEFRAFEMPPHARMSLTQQLLLRALVARFWQQPYNTHLTRWNTSLHDRFMLPHFIWQDFSDVIEEMQLFGYDLKPQWFAPHFEFRFPQYGRVTRQAVDLELRHAIEPWHVLGEETTASGTSRYVDSSVERLQVKMSGLIEDRHVVTCNGRRVPLHPTGTVGEFVAGVRYRAWQPPSCLHPTVPVDAPLVFDVIDTWMSRSIGGCTYYVSHPGGRASELFPVNAFEAESRRVARFYDIGHTPGPISAPAEDLNREFPLTLDLRRKPAR